MKSLFLSSLLTVASIQPHHAAPADAPIEEIDGGCPDIPAPRSWRPKAEPRPSESQATAADWVTAIAAVGSLILAALTLYVDIRKK